MKTHIFSGIDRISTVDGLLAGRRVGLMTNPTGVNHCLRSTIDILNEKYQLTALFAVEHGIRGDIPAGEKVGDSVDSATGARVFSAYGANSRFTDEMLDAFDILVFDMQDVGARFYTYLYSLAYAMQACDRAGKPVVVLDRVNPLGGLKRGGTIHDAAFASFVGNYALPTQYGLTLGEFARYVKDYLKLTVELTVVPLEGWSRALLLDDTDLPWIAPSPNIPSLAAAQCYIGTCVFEGVNVSEGRGTAQPFELIGAPWIDGEALEREMAKQTIPGAHFRRVAFRPTTSKHAGEPCRGVQLHVTDRAALDAFSAGLLLLDTLRAMYPDKLEFLYYPENGAYTVDRLLGTDAYRTGRLDARALIEAHRPGVAAFGEKVKPFLLYQ